MIVIITKDELTGLNLWEKFLKLNYFSKHKIASLVGDDEIEIIEEDARELGLLK